MQGFEVVRGQHSQGGVTAAGVVEAFDPLEDRAGRAPLPRAYLAASARAYAQDARLVGDCDVRPGSQCDGANLASAFLADDTLTGATVDRLAVLRSGLLAA